MSNHKNSRLVVKKQRNPCFRELLNQNNLMEYDMFAFMLLILVNSSLNVELQGFFFNKKPFNFV